MGLHTSQKSLLYYLFLHKSLVKASIINSWPNPNLKEETLCEKSTSQEARGLQNTRVKEEKFSPPLAAGKPRRKTPLDRRPNWKSKGKLRKRCCEVGGRKTIWGTTRKIQTFPHPPEAAAGKSKPQPEKPPESQIKHKLQGFKKNHEKNQRTISYLQHTPFAGIFVVAGKVAGDRRPDWNGRRSLRKDIMKLKRKDNQKIHPLFTSNHPFAGKHGRRRRRGKNFENHLHTHRSATSFFVLWRRERYKPKWASFMEV